jgi:glycosyltransferase involved in cell wall biosynthesis
VREYDVVHIHSVFSFPVLVASKVSLYHKRPYLVTPHGMLEPWALAYKAQKKAVYVRLIERRNLQRAAALHAGTLAEARQFRRIGLSTRTLVIPNGVSRDDLANLPDRDVFVSQYPELRRQTLILALGRIDPQKGLDLLIPAFARVVEETRRSDITLVLAGPDLIGYRPIVEGLIREYGLQRRVVFTGMLSGDVRRAALAAADVFVLPSHSEGFSMALLEAMAAGRPVIVSDACNFPEVAESGAGLVTERSERAVASGLMSVLKNAGLRQEMGIRGRALVRRYYTWDAIAARMIAGYEDLLNGAQASSDWLTGPSKTDVS